MRVNTHLTRFLTFQGIYQQAHREQSQAALRTLDQEEAALAEQLDTIEYSISEAETALRQARTAALLAKDTSLEASTAAQALSAEIDLSAKRTQLSTAKAEQAKQAKRLEKERETLHSKLAKAASDLPQLEEQLAALAAVEQETHAELGQTVYDSLSRAIEDALETEENLSAALAEYRSERLALESSIGAKLAAWPRLAKIAQAEVDVRLPAEEPASVQLAQEAKRYLRKLAEQGQSIEGTRGFPRSLLPRLFDFNASGVEAAMKPGFADKAQGRLNQLDQYIREIEQEAKEREWSVARYAR